MKWILSRNQFINEAKIRDLLTPPQKKRVVKVWGERFLDYEEVEPTSQIKQGKWKLSEEDKDMVINNFFKTDYAWVREKLSSIPDKFAEVLRKSLSVNLDANNLASSDKDKLKSGFKKGEEFNIKKLKISQISCLNLPIFKTLNASETKSDTRIVKDEKGVPKRDEKGNILKEPKEPGDPSFSNNLANLNTFIGGYNTSYPDEKVDERIFTHSNIQNITNMINDNPDIIDFDLFGDHEMFLLIEHNPSHIMNMSVSKFYKSCQELYFGGGHGDSYLRSLLINVFDPNSVPAFLVFNTPYYNITQKGGKVEKLSDVLPLCRSVIRSIEPFTENEDSKKRIYFDKTYPERMNTTIASMIEKYSDNKGSGKDYVRKYYFSPDISAADFSVLNNAPYMDSLGVVPGIRIGGKNGQSLYLSANIDWSNIVIKDETVIKELIIETPEIPSNLTSLKLSPDWVKFKYLKIKDITIFKNVITDSVSFYQCKLNDEFLKELYTTFPDIKKLSLCSVDIKDITNLSLFEKMEELELTYTISNKKSLEKILAGLNIKKLSISGDLLKNEKNKIFIESLRKKGINVKLTGLLI